MGEIMNQENEVMNETIVDGHRVVNISDYEWEKQKLIKKLTLYGIVSLGWFLVFFIGMRGLHWWEYVGMGLLCGLMFYIPARLKERFNWTWIKAIGVMIVSLAIIVAVSLSVGDWVIFLPLIVTIADIGYSIFRVIFEKKHMQNNEKP